MMTIIVRQNLYEFPVFHNNNYAVVRASVEDPYWVNTSPDPRSTWYKVDSDSMDKKSYYYRYSFKHIIRYRIN